MADDDIIKSGVGSERRHRISQPAYHPSQPAELGRAFGEIHRVLRLGHEVDVDFRFFEPPDIAQAVERAGFRVEMRLERLSYPREVQTRRAYLLARRQPRTKAAPRPARAHSS